MNKDDFLKMVKTTEKQQICLDFDGVIYKNSKGFHDGTLYDVPLDGAIESIKYINENLKYDLVIHTCKANPERPLINGKTGIELVWEWLEKYEISSNIKEVTYVKPNALYYIDDKGIRFESWNQILKVIDK